MNQTDIIQIYVLYKLCMRFSQINHLDEKFWQDKALQFLNDFEKLKNNSSYKFVPNTAFDCMDFVNQSIQILKFDEKE